MSIKINELPPDKVEHYRRVRRLYARSRRIEKPQENGAIAKRHRWKLKLETIAHYGEYCACCRESRPEFLVLDHVNGNGNKDRRLRCKGRGGIEFYRMLKREGYPPEFQVLCYNCNNAKTYFRKCPHES